MYLFKNTQNRCYDGIAMITDDVFGKVGNFCSGDKIVKSICMTFIPNVRSYWPLVHLKDENSGISIKNLSQPHDYEICHCTNTYQCQFNCMSVERQNSCAKVRVKEIRHQIQNERCFSHFIMAAIRLKFYLL